MQLYNVATKTEIGIGLSKVVYDKNQTDEGGTSLGGLN